MLRSRTWATLAIAVGLIISTSSVLITRERFETDLWRGSKHLATSPPEAALRSLSFPSEIEVSPKADTETPADGIASQRTHPVGRTEEGLLRRSRWNSQIRWNSKEVSPSLVIAVKSLPTFPPEAVQLGLSGYVLVEYTVSESGSTENLAILACSSPLFEPPVVEFMGRSTFRPRLSDGEVVATDNVKTLITFGEPGLEELPETEGITQQLKIYYPNRFEYQRTFVASFE